MAGMADIFQSSAETAQKISVDNRTSVIRTNRSIITTGRGSTPANIFTLPADNQRDGLSQPDLAQIPANTLNRIPKIVGTCVTGGVVVDKYTIPNSNPQRTQYVLALSHTHIDLPFSDYLTQTGIDPATALDVRVDGTTPKIGYCVTTLEATANNANPISGNNCWNPQSGNNPPEIYRNGKLCVFGNSGYVIGLADPAGFDTSDPEYQAIDSNFRVHVFCGWGGLDSGENQIFPRDGSDTGAVFNRPGLGNFGGVLFAVIQVITDSDLDITDLGEWRFGIDNSSNYLPAGNLNTRERRNNPSIILQQYLTDTRYGVGLNPEFIDTQSFEDWRINCDLDVFNGTAYGTNPGEWVYWDPDNTSQTFVKDRWMATNNAINTSLTVGENIKRITQSGLAQLHWDHEIQKFRVVFTRGISDLDIDQLYNFNPNNTINTIDITSGDFFNMPTFATVSYPDRRLSSESNSLRLDVSESDLAPNEPENGVSYEFPLINNRSRALVMGNISLYENRDDEIIEFTGDYTTRDTKVGEYVTITDPSQALDKTIVRLVRITEELTPEGGLYYKYQAKQYSDKPFQAQTYTDDPYVKDRPFFGSSEGNLISEISGSQSQQIRVEQIIVFDTNADKNNLSTPGLQYDITYSDPTSVVPVSYTSSVITRGTVEQGYGSTYMGTDSQGRIIGFKIKSNMTYHDTVKIEASVGDSEYWSPCYARQSYTIPGAINGNTGTDGSFTGNARYIVLGLDKLGQTGTTSQSDQYTWRINSFYSQSYPNKSSNVIELSVPMGNGTLLAQSKPTYTQTGTGMTIAPDGEVRISEQMPGTEFLNNFNRELYTSGVYDFALFPRDRYKVTIKGQALLNSQGLQQPGKFVANSLTRNGPSITLDVSLKVWYTENDQVFPSGAGNGDTTRYTDQYGVFTRTITAVAQLTDIKLSQAMDIEFESALEIWGGKTVFPTKAQFTLSGISEIGWLTPEQEENNESPDSVTATLSDVEIEISNYSRMREE